jgi:kynureninase
MSKPSQPSQPIQPKLDPELAQYRERYPILASTTYLNSNSMGAMPSTVTAALADYAQMWATEGGEAWEKWPALIDEVADTAARFIGAPPGQTTLNQNVAFFQACIASALDYPADKNEVVIESLMFPNLIYVWERFSDYGAELKLVPSDDGMTIATERMLEAIGPRTRIVVLSHAVYVSGYLHEVEKIVARAHEVGALVMVDVYQTAGCLPIDVAAWDADIVVGGSHKWLCGGPGTCFMWVKPEVAASLTPKTTGWMAHRDPFEFAPAPIEYAAGPWRFMGGTPSVPAYYAARAAYEPLLEVGIERIRAHNLALSQIIVDRALELGLTVHSPLEAHRRAGFVAVDFAGSEAASRALIDEHYKLDWRPGCGLRLGPHFYTLEAEVHRLMDRVAELAGKR